MSSGGASGPQDLYNRIGRALLDEAPQDDWTELRARYVATGRISEDTAHAIKADGSQVYLDTDRDLRRAFKELRDAMHDPERGIWYTATVTVSRDLRISVDFDYDHEPTWGLAISPLSYAEDLELLPRQDSAMPEWLRQRLAEAAAGR